MTHKIGKYVLNIALAFLIWMTAWSILNVVPIFADPILGSWSIAKVLGMFLALFLTTLAGRRVPLLRL